MPTVADAMDTGENAPGFIKRAFAAKFQQRAVAFPLPQILFGGHRQTDPASALFVRASVEEPDFLAAHQGIGIHAATDIKGATAWWKNRIA